MADTPVLIVGGSLNGLTTALLLARHGVKPLVVERHTGTSIQYKFAGISPRSMEIFRQAGIEEEIRARRTGDQQAGGIARGRTLSDPDIQWMMDSAWPDVSGLSAVGPATCDQHVLEPILRAHAEVAGTKIQFGTALVDLAEQNTGVDAILRDRASGTERTIRADYVIAADGAGGSTRERVGIGRTGAGVLQHWMNIIFETDLPPVLQGKRFTSCFVTDLNATFTPRTNGRWLLALQYDPGRERPESFDAERCRALVRKGAGRPDVRADLVDARAWEVAAYTADRFREGRTFLVGDAAHVMPPTGAFGGNTGIHDAHNLAWKLALVLRGAAHPALLETYDAERRPVVRHTLDQALARLSAWFKDPHGRLPSPVEIVDGYDVVFGQRYDTGALIRDEDDALRTRPFEEARQLSGLPGTRTPHLAIEQDGRRVPIHDLFGKGFVLLTGAKDGGWSDAVREVADTGVPLEACRMGPGGDVVDIDGRWPAAYGVTHTGAVLVRPDGIVAWRAREAPRDPRATLLDVCMRLGLRTKARHHDASFFA